MVKWIKRIFVALLAILAALIVFLVGSILIDFALGGNRLAEVTNTTIPGVNGSPDVRAYVARPAGSGPFPAVIMIHEFYGLNSSITGKADLLAQAGYLVVAPDTFRGSTTAWIPRAIYQVITSRPEQVNQDLDAVFAWIEKQPDLKRDSTGVMGFCYGGRASLAYGLHNPRIAATVVFYGSPVTDPQVLKNLSGPVLGIFGGADTSIPLAEVRAFEAGLKQAGIPNEITIYDGQPHAFVADADGIRAGGAQGKAWAQLLRFLDQSLKQSKSSGGYRQPILFTAPFDWGYYARLVFEHAIGSGSSHH